MAHRFLSLIPPLACASCAFAAGSDGLDAGRSDARDRADAAAGPDASPGPDAAAGAIDASIPDSSVPADAAPGAPDSAAIVDTVLITEIVDATLTGGLPKFVEITNLGSIAVDLSAYSLGHYNNGGLILDGGASKMLAGSLAAGASYVVSFENGDALGSSTFLSVYAEDADHLEFGTAINGDDAVVLFRGLATDDGSDAIVVDTYGEVGVDGSGLPWDYTDGFATRRQASTLPTPVFDVNDWGFSLANALDGLDGPGIAALTSPGTH